MDPLRFSGEIAFSALQAQSLRMKAVAQNIANAESTGNTPGADPYRRKTVMFQSELERLGIGGGQVKTEVQDDLSAFRLEYNPSHKAADAKGYVKMPNVNMVVEMADMRQSLRSYDANLQVIRQGRSMANGLIELLKSNG
jgi:flagellar basal-body rod protein FlgC